LRFFSFSFAAFSSASAAFSFAFVAFLRPLPLWRFFEFGCAYSPGSLAIQNGESKAGRIRLSNARDESAAKPLDLPFNTFCAFDLRGREES
jgi:hypothetical protein